jgi:hypothetical protein
LPSRRDPSSTPPLKTPACGFQRAIPGACIAGGSNYVSNGKVA